MGVSRLIVFAITIAAGRAHLFGLLPSLTDTARSLTDAVVAQPVVQFATDAVGGLVSSITDLLTFGPLSLGNIPNLLGDPRFTENAQNIITQFLQGLSNEDIKLGIQDFAKKYGYATEKHAVVTDDGYILSLFRIPGNGPPVFLMHGLLSSADDFVVAGRDTALAFLLSDDGYDVWMGNARGNKHSRHHVILEPSDPDFWNFSWHEIGVYDLPAMVDYVLNKTAQNSLKYIGHSQGTTSFFVMASELPEYNKKIDLMVALSPVAYMSGITSPVVRLLSANTEIAYGILKLIGAHEFLPDTAFLRALKRILCGGGTTAEILCSNISFLLAGFGYDQLNVTNLPVIYGHIPSGAATKQLVHYGQGIKSGGFRQYDYGASENFRRYGSSVPPDYKLDNIVANVSLFYSDADWLSAPSDVDTLYNKLPNAVDIHKVPYHPFNHLDYLWAKDLKPLIYERLRKLLSYF